VGTRSASPASIVHLASLLRRATLGLLALGATSIACAAPSSDDTASDDAASAMATREPDGDLAVRTSESPSGSEAFTFCANPRPGSAANLTNAAWLAMASANEYSHLRFVAPQLLDLGFGNAADSLWQVCASDMSRLRAFEDARFPELERASHQGPSALRSFMQRALSPRSILEQADAVSVGACARSFFEGEENGGHYTGLDDAGATVMPGRAFRDWLVRRNDPTSFIQFYSASPRSFFERRLGKGSTQAFVARHGTKPVVVVAFRGTEMPDANLQVRAVVDVLKDLDLWKADTARYGFGPGWGRTHRGFTEALESADDTGGRSLLTEKIRTLVQDDERVGVWITGHSLGGAVATLLTARLLDLEEKGQRFNLRGLVTFGAPRVGDETFARRMEEVAARRGVTLTRFRNDEDIVTSVPFDILGYQHVGQGVHLLPDGLDLLTADPKRGTSPGDHDSVGIVPTTREPKSGYYARVRARLRANTDPSLDACDDAP
jgi:hypothetical protein